METEVDFKMDMTWDEAYADPNSPETQALTTNLEGAVCISYAKTTILFPRFYYFIRNNLNIEKIC